MFRDNLRPFEIPDAVYWDCQRKIDLKNERGMEMATYTENFSLIKPDDEDYYDVADFNANMDIIDGELGGMADAFSQTGIKSIQRKTTTLDRNNLAPVIQIEPVNSKRCIVILENLCQYAEQAMSFDYKLTDTTIEPFICTGTYSTSHLGFWIIEFY